jgi:DNA polymerase (family 10)
VYAFLGYAWIPPELRENGGELEAARGGALPRLVEPADIRGDLHTHTDWSDGKATLEDMVAAAVGVGHRYLAICDHARRLRDGRIDVQAERIAELAKAFPDLRILSGIEVDIRANGSLDFPDEALAERDWVVASVHSGFQESSDTLTKRILSAIDNPHVDCIGHPTGRKIGRRAPYELDLETIFARAVETGTHLEINGQPDRLDLRDAHARAAAAAGASIIVSSDAHSTGALAYLDLAVCQARRAWLSAGQVANTQPWKKLAGGRR